LVLAGLATPLVFSVHTTVSFDFATSVIKGWHSTIYPPYFVAGAVFSGFAMVQTLLIIARKVAHLEEYITIGHIEIMNIVILITGGIVTVAYAVEYFIGWYSGSRYEDFTYLSPGAATGPYWWAFWALIFCNLIAPLIFWIKKFRRNIVVTFIVLSRDYLPSSWTMFQPTIMDVGVYFGTIGFFGVLFLLYTRTFPIIAQAELKSILKISGETYKAKEGDEHDHH
jgi:molybdopterin-containing oxidoreductase family membrane subunit